ncbi:toll/interleukin-1 receptor domain-containing protein [Peristeroidobacter soli]|uniref:toll/interleukin-1 receptor domain-containing protein n=1 Tax=Peristeroidobacter soli TaxID=2497877 RepID=UPI00101D8103|nr:toll/interleukin-1 receptor domain-containing protein [Peristeroidobacter soli]
MKWDLFISYASEDRIPFVTTLANGLNAQGYKVWYDEFSLVPGDSLRRSIDHGLARSAAGIVVLSPSFFEKEWPQMELSALTGQEVASGKPLVTIWHNMDRDAVARYSPLIADKIAIPSGLGITDVIEKIKQALHARLNRDTSAAIGQFSEGRHHVRSLTFRSLMNFHQIAAYYSAYDLKIKEEFEARPDNCNEDDDDDSHDEAFERRMQAWEGDARRRFGIPPDAYIVPDGPLTSGVVTDIERRLKKWCNGTLGQHGSAALFFDLDHWLDADYLYILYSIPNFSVSPRQREELEHAIAAIGSSKCSEETIPWETLLAKVVASARSQYKGRVVSQRHGQPSDNDPPGSTVNVTPQRKHRRSDLDTQNGHPTVSSLPE